MPVKVTPLVDLQIFLFPAKSAHPLQLGRRWPLVLFPILWVLHPRPVFAQEPNAVIQESAIESHDIVPSEEERAAAAAQEPFKEPSQREPASVTVSPAKSDEEKVEATAPSESPAPQSQPEEAVKTEHTMPEVKLMKAPKSQTQSVDPETALKWLKNGNVRFTHNRIRKDGQSASDRARVMSGEHPHAVVLACSDSRTPPEILFDQKLGEIFVVRTLGETAEPSAIASIEYAVEKLGVRLIVVMGHERCEAVQTATEPKDDAKADESVSSWERVVSEIRGHLPPRSDSGLSENLASESTANAQGVAKDLAARSATLKKHLESGDLKIQSAIYHLGSGVVEFK